MKVGILGAGAYGTALGGVLEKCGNRAWYFDPYVLPEVGLEEVLRKTEIILLAVPAATAKEVLGQIPEKFCLRPLIVATKGIMSLKEYTRKFYWVEVLSGPGFAEEIKNGKRVRLTVATGAGIRKERVEEKQEDSGRSYCEQIFRDGSGRGQVEFDFTEDRQGVLLLGGLKNLYAIGAGARKLAKGSSEFKEYIGLALREAEKFLILNGGFLETVRLSAGLGDFVLTCGGRESRNYNFGFNGFKKSGKETVEGLMAAKEIRRLKLKIPEEAKILKSVLERV